MPHKDIVMTAMELITYYYQQMHRVANKEGWGNPHAGGRATELVISGILGHKIGEAYSGADAYDEDGACEYKSTSYLNKKGDAPKNWKYGGISRQTSWRKQVKYLKEEKISCYKNHYFVWIYEGLPKKIWRIKGDVVYLLLKDKIYGEFERKKHSNNYKDPGISTTLSFGDVQRVGTLVYENKGE